MKTSEVPVIFLAGGLGTRMSEVTSLKPKPMVEIGGRPILWHLILYYSSFGFKNFIICAGYKSHVIKEYFENLLYIDSSVSFDYSEGISKRVFNINPLYKDIKITVLDTGLESMTGSRVHQALDYLRLNENDTFALTYGDGLTDANLTDVYEEFKRQKKMGLVLGVHPKARFGLLDITNDGTVTNFSEKPQTKTDFINGGFFFFKASFKNYLSRSIDCVLEQTPLEKLAKDDSLACFRHEGFWQCIDTLKDKNFVHSLWESNEAPWKKWD